MDTQQSTDSSDPSTEEKPYTSSTLTDMASPNNGSLLPGITQTIAPEAIAPDLVLAQAFTLAIPEDVGQLNSIRQTNTPDELSIPREIISTSDSSRIRSIISSTTIYAECLRPIFAGTYHGMPAYLLILQFQFDTGSSQSMKSRIQNATINVIVEDAPSDKNQEPDTPPSIAKTFPGPEGFEGTVSAATVSIGREIGLEVGWNGLGVTAGLSQTRERQELGALKLTAVRKGRYRDSLVVNVMEDSVQKAGLPFCLTIPLIVIHHSRRFSMDVSLNAKFGFWRDVLVPVRGGGDDPLFFDPTVLARKMETGERGVGGVKVVEWRNELEDIDLKEYSSLARGSS